MSAEEIAKKLTGMNSKQEPAKSQPENVEDDDAWYENEDPEGEGDPQEGQEGEGDDEGKAPTLEEFKKLQRAHDRDVAKLKKLREQVKKDVKAEITDDDAANIRTETETVWKTRFVKQAARSALIQAGVSKGVDKLMRLIDTDDIEVDENGEIDGLDEQVESIKADFEELFNPGSSPRRQTNKRNIDGADKGGSGTSVKLTSQERLARQLVGED